MKFHHEEELLRAMQTVGEFEYGPGDLIGHGAFALVFGGRHKKVSNLKNSVPSCAVACCWVAFCCNISSVVALWYTLYCISISVGWLLTT